MHATQVAVFSSKGCGADAGLDCPWGSVWAYDITWRRCDSDDTHLSFDGVVRPARLRAWLRARLVHIAMPHVRPYNVLVHHLPAALPCWWRVVQAVAKRVPPHWLECALALLLDTSCAQHRIAVPSITHNCNYPAKAAIGTWQVTRSKAEQWDLGAIGA